MAGTWETERKEPGFTLTFHPNGTYQGTVRVPGKPPIDDKGIWSVDGATLTLTPVERNGKKVDRDPLVATIAPDGNSFEVPGVGKAIRKK